MRPPRAHRLARPVLLPLVLLALLAPRAVAAQDDNVRYSVEYLMQRLTVPELDIVDMAQARPMIRGDRSARVTLGGEGDEPLIAAHWKPVQPPGDGFNNEPRYEIAAYRFQQLFLDEPDYVVPPKVLRAVPFEEYEGVREERRPTIRGTNSFLFILSYWVEGVTNQAPWSQPRFQSDPEYARRWGNVNIFTHLIDHRDSNVGNLLISLDPSSPRVFSTDNDVAWRSQESDVGTEWRVLQVNRLPRAPVERLRALTRDDLVAALEVVAEFAIVDGRLEAVEPGPNLDRRRGLRVTRERVQYGLTEAEINDTWNRIRSLLQQVDRGRITLF